MDLSNVTFRDILKIFYKRRWLFVVGPALALAATYVALALTVPTYQAETKLLVQGVNQVNSPLYHDLNYGRTVELAATLSEVVKSRDLLAEVVSLLKLDQRRDEDDFRSGLGLAMNRRLKAAKQALADLGNRTRRAGTGWLPPKKSQPESPETRFREAVEALGKHVKITNIEKTDIILISVQDYNPEIAAHVAERLAEVFIYQNLKRQLHHLTMKSGSEEMQFLQIKQDVDRFRAYILGNRRINIASIIDNSNIQIVEKAQAPLKPLKPKKSIAYAAAFVLSLLGVFLYVFLREGLKNTITLPQEIHKQLHLSVLGSIPAQTVFRSRRLSGNMKSRGPYVQAFQVLADHLYFLLKKKSIRSLALVSMDAREGKTTCAMNLAFLLGKKNHMKILAIDGDLRHAGLTRAWKPDEPRPQLAEVLKKTVPPAEAVSAVDAQIDLLPSAPLYPPADRLRLGAAWLQKAWRGLRNPRASSAPAPVAPPPPNPMALFGLSGLRDAIRALSSGHELTIVDLPAWKKYGEALAASAQVDAVILVIREDYTTQEALEVMMKQLHAAEIPVLGAVLTRRHYLPQFLYHNA